jgi:uncharacterized FlaG/YvyC family protein
MLNTGINQITTGNANAETPILGTQFKSVELSGIKIDLEQLRKTFTFKGLERVNALLEQTKKISTKSMDDKTKQNLQELIEKLKKAAERFGVRLEMDNTRVGDPLIRVYNRINNRQLTTIPLQMLLKMLVTVRTPDSLKAGNTPGQEFSPELIDNAAQDMADTISNSAKTNIII